MVMFQNKVPSHGWHIQALESRPEHVKNEKQLTDTLLQPQVAGCQKKAKAHRAGYLYHYSWFDWFPLKQNLRG